MVRWPPTYLCILVHAILECSAKVALGLDANDLDRVNGEVVVGGREIPKGNQPGWASSDDCDLHLIVFGKVWTFAFWKWCGVDVVRVRGKVGHEEKNRGG